MLSEAKTYKQTHAGIPK